MIKIALKDGSIREYEKGTRAIDIARDISEGLARNVLAVEVNGAVRDLSYAIQDDAGINFLKFDDKEGKKAYWHTTSHILAQAVKREFADVRLAIGPAIDQGFYYDFDLSRTFSENDIETLERRMAEIIKENLMIERFELSRSDALELMKNEPYKIELINELPEDEAISFYRQGEYTDLCAGPHLLSTGDVKAVKLLSVAGAYWRGSEKNKMLQRIYGISFTKKSDLEAYMFRLEEAKKRDHRKLGRELELFDIFDEGPGFPVFLPKGMTIKNLLIDFWRQEHRKRGYKEISTPIILNKELWIRSGHWDNYKENMYTLNIDESEYAIKPMNCPGGILVYKKKLHSYRDFPERIGELGLVHRHELSGALHGLMRVRCFTQDDAHIYMTPEQIKDEVIGVIELIDDFYKVFGFKYNVELSTRPKKSIGTDEMWERSTTALKEALDMYGTKYKINEGDGAFYGPKIDFHIEDSIGRTWQCGTIQLDMNLPERFDLTYISADGNKHRPVMIHRVVFGSMERFIAILTEHFAGAFPLWLAPEQVRILPLADKHQDHAFKLSKELECLDIRTSVDGRNEKIGYRIREARLEKIPYIVVIGDNETAGNTVSVRKRGTGDLGTMDLDVFKDLLVKEVAEKTIWEDKE
jgi:threonyl-tRNA synthetase